MKVISLKLNEEVYKKLEALSKEKKTSIESLVEELISKSLEDELLKKAKKIIKEEKSLLKKLA